MTTRTVKKAIEQLKEWYKDDLDQLITIYTHDRDEIWNSQVAESDDGELLEKYPTPKDLPQDLVEEVLGNLFDSDSVWNSLRSSENYDWNNWHSKKQKEEFENQMDKELWDKE